MNVSAPLLIAVLLMAGCTTAHVEATRQTPTRIEAHESIAIVVSHDATELASDAVGCISKSLKETFPALRIVPPDKFHKAAFPDVAPELAARAVIYLPLLLNDPAFRVRIAPLGLRYLISIQGKTEQQAKPIAEADRSGLTAFGAVWDRKSDITASVVDLKQSSSIRDVKASASGTPWFVCIGLGPLCAPIGAPAFTEAKACDEIGKGVVKFLAGSDPTKVSEDSEQPANGG